MTDDRWTRRLFVVATVWNLQAVVCLVAPSLVQTILLGAPMQGPGAFLWFDLWGFVVIMGLGSALVAWQPERNRGVAVVAALGKTTAAVHWAAMSAWGIAPAALVLGALGDGLLGVAMFAWLFATRPLGTPAAGRPQAG